MELKYIVEKAKYTERIVCFERQKRGKESMGNSRKYEYVMDKTEVRECSLFLLWEIVKQQKGFWLTFALFLAVMEFAFDETFLTLLGIGVFLVRGLSGYGAVAKILRGQPSAVWIEGDKLKATRRDYIEIPCKDIQKIRRTKRILLMSCVQEEGRESWFMIPLRTFAGEQEVEGFLAMLQGSQNQEQNQWQAQDRLRETEINRYSQYRAQTNFADSSSRMTDGEDMREYLRLSCQMNGERWVRLQRGTVDLLNDGSLGTHRRLRGMTLQLCVVAGVLTAYSWLEMGKLDLLLLVFLIALSAWLSVWLWWRDPEKKIRRQWLTPQALFFVCGFWQFSLTEKGICVSMPADRKKGYLWERLSLMAETENAFSFFSHEKKPILTIPKESFATWEQADLFQRICAERGIKKIAPKKARYVPGWLMGILLGVILLAFYGSAAVKFFGGVTNVPGSVSDGYQRVPGSVSDDYQRVPLDEQVEVLESLGLHVPEETIEAVRTSMEEYGVHDMVEESPYTWLLTDMGAPEYDEEWKLTGYATEVFWFDFEGFDITTDYITVLDGMRALAKGSCLDDVTKIREDWTEADLEDGKGVITVSLIRKGQTYSYTMEMYYDWIDSKVLGIWNLFLEQEGSQKYFYAAGDNGQGAIVFFCTPTWAEQFTKKTGLVLETGITEADEVK